MAFVAKDGSKHTNHDSMKAADSKHMAKTPHEPVSQPDGEAEGPEIQNIDDLQNAFDQHMQEEASGQPHDPHNIAKLKKHFSQYADDERQEG
jgi:hypothetical protein